MSRAPLRRPSLAAVTYVVGVVVVLEAIFHFVPLGGDRPPLWWPPWIVLAVLLLLDLPASRRLARLARVETGKLFRSRLFQAALVGTAAVTIFAALTWQEPEAGASAWTMTAGVLGAGQWAAEVFLLVLGATAISGEATGGTLKMILPHAYARSDWIRAKAAVLVLAAILLTIVAAGIAVIAAAWTRGFDDVFIPALFGGEPEIFLTADALRSILFEVTLAGLAALVATAMLGLFLSALFDNVVASLCVAFLLFFGLKLADVVLGLPFETMALLYTWHPGEMRTVLAQLGRAFSETPWNSAYLPTAVSLALITSTAAILLAIAVFQHRDLKGS